MTATFVPKKSRACDGKRGYTDRKSAKDAAKKAPDHRVFAYACDFCPRWHIGHRPKGLFG